MTAQPVNSDSWAATDALGRKVRSYADAPAKKADKFVAMFYWTWHREENCQPMNISEVLRDHPEALWDYEHPAWGPDRPGCFYWEQPLLGYYSSTDKWVLRKHAEMLADAGVDAVFFDCTNADLTFKDAYEALLETWDIARKDGVNVPKIAFILNLCPAATTNTSIHEIYNDLYKPRRYENLWFIWKGKPCIMAYPESLDDSAESREIADFFTFRPGQPDYVFGPTEGLNDQWGWLEDYPQHGYVTSTGPDGSTCYEQVTVGVAQNTSPDVNGHAGAFNVKDSYGRSFSVRNGFDPRPDGYLYGWNFSEQWDRAYELDPELVFVTGWNEFTAGMWKIPGWNGDPFSFVDEFDWNHSRDIEPNKGWGDKGDVYYLQLVDRIRKFKGMTPAETATDAKTIRIRNFRDWDDVGPYFASYKGNTGHRDCRGRTGDLHYTNETGRNDIVGAKVARDDDYLWFYVETAEKLTSKKDPHWMQLFIDVDRDKSTGWNGYDYVVNRVSPGRKAVLEKCSQNIWEWEKTEGCRYFTRGNKLVIRIPRAALGLGSGPVDIEFKWNDNMQEDGDIMDFYVNGDTAPGGRFNFVYETEQAARL